MLGVVDVVPAAVVDVVLNVVDIVLDVVGVVLGVVLDVVDVVVVVVVVVVIVVGSVGRSVGRIRSLVPVNFKLHQIIILICGFNTFKKSLKQQLAQIDFCWRK